MDPMSLVIGAAIALGGVLVGRWLPKRIDPQSQPSSPQQQHQAVSEGQRASQAICGCGHHLVFHDKENKMCQAQVVIPGRWTDQPSNSYRTCMCQGYRGPMPVDEYYAPDLFNGES